MLGWIVFAPMPQDFADEETDLLPQHEPASSGVTWRCPVVRWSDASGAHEVALRSGARVGSAASAEIVLNDAAVSRLHAEFEIRDGAVWVSDLASRNGTFVNGVMVAGARVPPEAHVRMGSTTLTFGVAPTATSMELWPGEEFGPLVGRSLVMRQLFAQLARVAESQAAVLIHGETGTGKELVAHAIHEASPRASGPLVVVDCAALPEHQLEAELFGHAKGAFTGASAARIGSIEAADGGTVFLDEVGELPLAMQPKLLRAVETRTVRRVGETEHRNVDVRFVSATHRDLGRMVNAGAFREDLYFRLAVLPVAVPPLRARPEDVPLLIRQFLPPDRRGEITPELGTDLSSRPWPGNVRELRNFADRLLALGPDAAIAAMSLTPSRGSLPPSPPSARTGLPSPPPPVPSAAGLPFKEAREQALVAFERAYILDLLARHGHGVAAAAQSAGLDRTYLYRLIRKHQI
jgi:two-component system response regulator GlrR